MPPNSFHHSQVICGWLADLPPDALAAQVAGWDAAAWEDARWAIQVHGIGPLLHHTFASRPRRCGAAPALARLPGRAAPPLW